MANKYTDTDKWDDDWFLSLSPVQKCIWNFLCDNVKGCGEMKISFKKLTDCIGAPITRAEFDEAFEGRVFWIESDVVWVPGTLARMYRKFSPRIKAEINVARKVVRMTEGIELSTRGAVQRQRCIDFLNSLCEQPSPIFPDQALTSPQPAPYQALSVKSKEEEVRSKEEGESVRGEGLPQMQTPLPPGYAAFADRLDREKQELVSRAEIVLTTVLDGKPSPDLRNCIPAILRSVDWNPDEFARHAGALKTRFDNATAPITLTNREYAVKRTFGLIKDRSA